MGVSDEAKNVIPLKFLRKIKNFFFPSCKLNPGTYCTPGILIRQGSEIVKFGIVKVYVEKECRKIKFMYSIQGVPKKRDKSITPLFMGGF
jgi:hypothetical protein